MTGHSNLLKNKDYTFYLPLKQETKTFRKIFNVIFNYNNTF